MNEALRNLAVLMWAVCAINNSAQAQTGKLMIAEEALPAAPTVIIGEARKPSGGFNESIVEQPADGANPLGVPIVNDNAEQALPATSATPNPSDAATSGIQSSKAIRQSAPSGALQNSELPLPQPNNNIENELYQSGNDIMDVQEYPINDIKTITETNVQPTVVSQ